MTASESVTSRDLGLFPIAAATRRIGSWATSPMRVFRAGRNSGRRGLGRLYQGRGDPLRLVTRPESDAARPRRPADRSVRGVRAQERGAHGRASPVRVPQRLDRGDFERQDRPPKITTIRYRLTVVTDEPPGRVRLLHENIQHHGTIFNTLAEVCEVTGEIVAVAPASLPML